MMDLYAPSSPDGGGACFGTVYPDIPVTQPLLGAQLHKARREAAVAGPAPGGPVETDHEATLGGRQERTGAGATYGILYRCRTVVAAVPGITRLLRHRQP